MNYTTYLISQAIVLLIVIGLLYALLTALGYALEKMKIPAEKRKNLLLFTGLGFIFWLVILALGALSGFFSNYEARPSRFLFVLVPPLILIIYLFFSRLFTIILKIIPQAWLLYIQSFRILVELMLWMGFMGGFVPPQMTFAWLNQDIVVGITAPMAGFVFFGKGRFRKFETFIWNIFGIALLINIILISILSTPSSYRVFMNEPANTFMAAFPYIWISGFIVPFALAMHLFSLRQLFLKR